MLEDIVKALRDPLVTGVRSGAIRVDPETIQRTMGRAADEIEKLRGIIRATAPEIEVRKRLSFAEAEAIYGVPKRTGAPSD